MVSSRYSVEELADFLYGFGASGLAPLSKGSALDEMIEGFQREGSMLLGQLAAPIPEQHSTRAIFLVEEGSFGKCFLTSEGKFLQVQHDLRQISSQEAADTFGAVEIAQALANRVLERLNQYRQITDTWEATLVQVREKLASPNLQIS